MELEDVRKRLTGDGELEGHDLLTDALWLLDKVDAQERARVTEEQKSARAIDEMLATMREASTAMERLRAELSDAKVEAHKLRAQNESLSSTLERYTREKRELADRVHFAEGVVTKVREALRGGM